MLGKFIGFVSGRGVSLNFGSRFHHVGIQVAHVLSCFGHRKEAFLLGSSYDWLFNLLFNCFDNRLCYNLCFLFGKSLDWFLLNLFNWCFLSHRLCSSTLFSLSSFFRRDFFSSWFLVVELEVLGHQRSANLFSLIIHIVARVHARRVD